MVTSSSPAGGGGKASYGGCCGEDSLVTNATRYHQPNGMDKEAADQNLAKALAPFAGTAQNLFVRVWNAPGAVGKNWVWTLMVNGAPTALTVTIENLETANSDLVNAVTIAAGDQLSLRCVPANAPVATYATWGFELTPS